VLYRVYRDVFYQVAIPAPPLGIIVVAMYLEIQHNMTQLIITCPWKALPVHLRALSRIVEFHREFACLVAVADVLLAVVP
jgi:hypothetical protein